jgi:hypothetical protein
MRDGASPRLGFRKAFVDLASEISIGEQERHLVIRQVRLGRA